jgi:hypothetical protein
MTTVDDFLPATLPDRDLAHNLAGAWYPGRADLEDGSMRATCAAGRPARRATGLGGWNRGRRRSAQPRPRPAPPPDSRLEIATRNAATDGAVRNAAGRRVGSAAVRIRFVLLALLALAVGACAAPQGHAGRAAAATTGSTAVTRPAAGTGQTRYPPRGILPAARRRPAPELRVTAFDAAR